jgi:hypothetical protein
MHSALPTPPPAPPFTSHLHYACRAAHPRPLQPYSSQSASMAVGRAILVDQGGCTFTHKARQAALAGAAAVIVIASNPLARPGAIHAWAPDVRIPVVLISSSVGFAMRQVVMNTDPGSETLVSFPGVVETAEPGTSLLDEQGFSTGTIVGVAQSSPVASSAAAASKNPAALGTPPLITLDAAAWAASRGTFNAIFMPLSVTAGGLFLIVAAACWVLLVLQCTMPLPGASGSKAAMVREADAPSPGCCSCSFDKNMVQKLSLLFAALAATASAVFWLVDPFGYRGWLPTLAANVVLPGVGHAFLVLLLTLQVLLWMAASDARFRAFELAGRYMVLFATVCAVTFGFVLIQILRLTSSADATETLAAWRAFFSAVCFIVLGIVSLVYGVRIVRQVSADGSSSNSVKFGGVSGGGSAINAAEQEQSRRLSTVLMRKLVLGTVLEFGIVFAELASLYAPALRDWPAMRLLSPLVVAVAHLGLLALMVLPLLVVAPCCRRPPKQQLQQQSSRAAAPSARREPHASHEAASLLRPNRSDRAPAV